MGVKGVVVAFGGNAISRPGEKGTFAEQLAHVKKTCRQLAQLIREGFKVVITHGNGPQVGSILLQNEAAAPGIPPMPLDVCVAESQGMVGYMIQQSLSEELHRAGQNTPVVSLITQVLVDPDDPAFGKPTKPVGPFYSGEEAEKLHMERGWQITQDGSRGFRRVVPSPWPAAIVEGGVIKELIDRGVIVIATGGGGIPVVRTKNGEIKGVEGVIDKDLAAQRLAADIGAEYLVMLTDIDRVAVNYKKPGQRFLDHIDLAEGRRLHREGHFAAGSMGPKVESALKHIEAGGELAAIGALENTYLVATGCSGTRVTLTGPANGA